MLSKHRNVQPVPHGYCHCGCGRKTPIATRNSTHHGYVKGEPKKWIHGHGSRGRPVGQWERFGRLVAVEEMPPSTGSVMVLCACDCDRSVIVKAANLLSGGSTSCGCKVTDPKIHGLARRGDRHPSFGIWCGIRARCDDQENEAYGGRGIRVCARWRAVDGFANFVTDMGVRPEDLTIERIDNDGNYSCGHCEECIANGWPANCRWATRWEQAQNRRPWGTSTGNTRRGYRLAS